MKPFLIAEFGNCHDGSMDQAKELIRVAKESGASAAKGQAFHARDVKGSMPPAFYEARQLSPVQLLELIQYGNDIGIDVFFSIFSKEYECLHAAQKWQKYSASQSKKKPREIEQNDGTDVIVSVNPHTRYPDLQLAQVLYATAYLVDDPHLEYIDFLTEFYARQVGYSDHTVGIQWALAANRNHGAQVIEKHFTLTRDIYYEGTQFRDAIHAATPRQFELLAGALK